MLKNPKTKGVIATSVNKKTRSAKTLQQQEALSENSEEDASTKRQFQFSFHFSIFI
jgi:hypothetical protein